MKRLIAFLYIVLLTNLAVFSQTTADALWRQAQAEEKQENYSKAIELYKRCRNATTDKLFKEDCDDRINALELLVSQPFINAPDTVVIPYTGEYQKITIMSNPRSWSFNVVKGVLREVKKDGSQLLVVSQPNNTKLDTIVAAIRITAGKLSRDIVVIQQPSPEFLHSSSEELNVLADGEQCQVDISANYKEWTFEVDSTWIKVNKTNDKLIINVSPNDLARIREGKIVLRGKEKTLTIRIFQGAGDEKMMFSHNNLYFPVEGETRTIAVYTNADNWYVGNCPDWCTVDKIGSDSISITTFRNTSDNIPREASVNVNTGLQTKSIRIYQDARPYVPTYAPTIKGRNVSFGLSVSYSNPFILVSSGGDYTGSVVNYGLCNKDENASYYSALGFSMGILLDIRLYRNIFMNIGLDYNYTEYQNRFDKKSILTIPVSNTSYIKGEVENSYNEIYRLHFLNLPIISSYRFAVNDNSHVQINLGPVISYGLSARLNLNGNTHGEKLKEYSNMTDQYLGYYHKRAFSINSDMDLFNDKEISFDQVYTIGNDYPETLYRSFEDSPFNRLSFGIKVGVAYEWSGLSMGISYYRMVSNMANSGYWDNHRWNIMDAGVANMAGYEHHINSLNISLAYIFRYLRNNNK
ncbi:MAG: outer membrane beta-barrel protein [Bacteroidaceae bacterium]|nr:outer membrane beta-barrel protein [Bacteroidaceae bacterium]